MYEHASISIKPAYCFINLSSLLKLLSVYYVVFLFTEKSLQTLRSFFRGLESLRHQSTDPSKFNVNRNEVKPQDIPVTDLTSPINEDYIIKTNWLTSIMGKRDERNRRAFNLVNCDPHSLTTSMLLEMAKTGTLCGQRIKHVRFALAGR